MHDSACDWAGAHAAFDDAAASGACPDRQAHGALIRALWCAGSVGACQLAVRAFDSACQLGVFR
jgi:hypothetical protein